MNAARSVDARHIARDFVSRYLDAPRERRFVLGRGEYAASLVEAIEVEGVVDDFTADAAFAGLPIYKSRDLPDGAMVVVASMLRPLSAIESLKDLPVDVLDYFAFERVAPLPVKPVAFWPAFRDDYQAHRDRYDAVRARLADEESRSVFDRLVEFRLDSDLSVMEGFRFDLVNQYFEEFLELRVDGEAFVDIGCFDGQTSLEFARRAPGFAHITAFEPSRVNLMKVRSNLARFGDDRVSLYECGLSDVAREIRFAASAGSSSRASDDGDSVVQVLRLDDVPLKAATFIKIDIEGGEIPALSGARRTIAEWAPRLAISVYHHATDFWRIPAAVDEAGVEYRLHLRHYTEGIDETVMFFIPST